MKLDNQRESGNIEDVRDQSGGSYGSMGGGSGLGGGGGLMGLLPLLFSTLGVRGIVILAVVYFALKMFLGVDLINLVNGGGGGFQMPTNMGTHTVGQSGAGVQPGGVANPADASADPGKHFVAKILASTDDVWTKVFSDMGKQYEQPTLVLFSGVWRSGCGTAQASSGPFYCPADHKVYIDLSFYQELKTKLGSPGDFAQAYVVAHEVGHHVQNLLGIADQVQNARSQSSEAEANALSVKMELQADCFAGAWATEADATKHILENGDIEEALNAASQIGDDHLQKSSQGYAVPDTFTHGSSAQRVKWFKTGLAATSLNDCDTFGAANL
jgi:uncharacterized protein